jgi:serine/threonine protein kinase
MDSNQLKVCRLAHIHSRNFVHRDLKPSNILIGVGKRSSIVHVIDFGLSKEFRDPLTHQHIPLSNALGLIGTATFASVNSHLGLELGRRDDLESLAYILIYFLRGSLPWQGLEFKEHDFVLERKQRTSVHELCHGLPVEFGVFLEYSQSLSFVDKPDYNYLCGLFNTLLSQQRSQGDLTCDWDTPNGQSAALFETPKERVVSRRHNAYPERRTG